MESLATPDSDSHHPIGVGQVLLGKYRIERVIGQGGMGLVLGATHVELQHRVAIKVLLPAGIGSDTIETRFLREAQAAASIRSENVVRVFDVGRLEDHRPYMVMEWLEGRDLSTGPMGAELPTEEAVDYMVQACDAMAAAHARNLVHRDLKPANLFLAQDEHGIPTIKVLDFGISKLKRNEEANPALTEANGVMGSPLYMSPEQVRSARDVDARADIWSLGTILYELLTGVPPFNGETLGAVFIAVAGDNPRPLSELRPDLPSQLDVIISKCLEKDPDKRYQRAQDLQQALLPLASARSQAKMVMRSSSAPPGMALSSRPQVVLAATPAVHATRTTGGWSESASRERQQRHRVGLIALGIVTFGVFATGGLGWLWMARNSDPRTASSTSSDLNSLTASPSALATATASVVLDVLPVPTPATSVAEPASPHEHSPGAKPNSEKPGPSPRKRTPGNEKDHSSVEAPAATRAIAPVSPAPDAAKPAAPAVKKNPLDIQFK